ncbi:hypothetical protein Taro_040734, partial [Colocasia esculenta]|nr:hypothetical protein [Colocasia esculenta]
CAFSRHVSSPYAGDLRFRPRQNPIQTLRKFKFGHSPGSVNSATTFVRVPATVTMPRPSPAVALLCRRHRLSGSSILRPLLSHYRSFSVSVPSSHDLEFDLSHPTYVVWGANTGVGKTLVSAGLAASVLCDPRPAASATVPSQFLYIKPAQTGFPQDSDSRFVHRKVSDLFLRRRDSSPLGLLASNHVLKASAVAAVDVAGVEQLEDERDEGLRDLGFYEERRVGGVDWEGEDSKLICKTLYAWREAISPHLAAKREKAGVEDAVLLKSLKRCLSYRLESGGSTAKDHLWRVIETAGGVASPGPSGVLQCDLYRPFRLPTILVGDGQLGGISGTVSSYETLNLRGYDVVAIILQDHGLENEMSLLSYLRNRVPVLVMPPVPQDPSNDLMEWFSQSSEIFSSLQDLMLAAYLERIQRLHDIGGKAGNILWWPFTQHKLVPEEAVTVIDSRCGENFSVYKVCTSRLCSDNMYLSDDGRGWDRVTDNKELLIPQFDACASWWTQGPDAALQIELARDMGYAAGRFGHVMFPENAHEPAVRCTELLLEGVGKGWASRAFFSDNGSTAVEIALKMAFRKFSLDHGIHLDSTHKDTGKKLDYKVLALSGSYHGDTLGAMEAQAPSSYTGFLQQPWYSGRGLFLEPPTIYLSNGHWSISLTEALQVGMEKIGNIKVCFNASGFSSQDKLFCWSRGSSVLAQRYSAYISEQLSRSAREIEMTYIAALILEPGKENTQLSIKCSTFGNGMEMINMLATSLHNNQGAGGMLMIDPLFQRVLVKECKSRNIPVIFDEVFTGFWRLGSESAAELLGCVPDVACYGKLLTGGVIPLAVTLATEAIFTAFTGDSKIKALLHGHSYSAHPMGCTAASKAIQWFKDPSSNLNLNVEQRRLR